MTLYEKGFSYHLDEKNLVFTEDAIRKLDLIEEKLKWLKYTKLNATNVEKKRTWGCVDPLLILTDYQDCGKT